MSRLQLSDVWLLVCYFSGVLLPYMAVAHKDVQRHLYESSI